MSKVRNVLEISIQLPTVALWFMYIEFLLSKKCFAEIFVRYQIDDN